MLADPAAPLRSVVPSELADWTTMLAALLAVPSTVAPLAVVLTPLSALPPLRVESSAWYP